MYDVLIDPRPHHRTPSTERAEKYKKKLSAFIRCGFAGDPHPLRVIPSVIGNHATESLHSAPSFMPGGDEADRARGHKRGLVRTRQEWEEVLTEVFSRLYTESLQCRPRVRSILDGSGFVRRCKRCWVARIAPPRARVLEDRVFCVLRRNALFVLRPHGFVCTRFQRQTWTCCSVCKIDMYRTIETTCYKGSCQARRTIILKIRLPS